MPARLLLRHGSQHRSQRGHLTRHQRAETSACRGTANSSEVDVPKETQTQVPPRGDLPAHLTLNFHRKFYAWQKQVQRSESQPMSGRAQRRSNRSSLGLLSKSSKRLIY